MVTVPRTLEFEANFSGFCVVRPGDKLVVAMRDHVSMQQADDIKRRLCERLGIDDCVIIGAASGIAVVRSIDD